MAFTSDVGLSGSGSPHLLEVQASGQTEHVELAGSKNGNSGNMWEFTYSDFGFPRCLYKNKIKRVSLVENGNDGWNIGSIVILLDDAKNNTMVLTKDFHINRWIDGDELPEYKHFDLTLVI